MRTRSLILAVLVIFAALPAEAEKWKQLRKSEEVELWIDLDSVKVKEGEGVLDYRVDYRAPQKEHGSDRTYKSTKTRAIVRCPPRAIKFGPTVAFEGPRLAGKLVGRYPPAPEEARFQPVERGSSDETLWHYVCHVATVIPK